MKWLLAIALIAFIWLWLSRSRTPAMPADEIAARRLLGVSPRADAEAIRTAHRRRLADVHPDRGGSEDEAGRLNAARDLLLRRP